MSMLPSYYEIAPKTVFYHQNVYLASQNVCLTPYTELHPKLYFSYPNVYVASL